MEKKTLKAFSLVLAATVGLAGCDGLGKMVTNSKNISYSITPNPLEEHGDSVTVAASGKFPPKYFAKKVALTVTPVIKYSTGGEKTLKPMTLLGEKAEGTGTRISNEKGGNFSYSQKVAYQDEMKNCVLNVKATGAVKSKTKEFPAIKVADGTIITPLLVKSDEKPIMAKDAFVKTKPVSIIGSIFYVVSQSVVRPTEMTNPEMKAVKEFIEKGIAKGYEFKGVNVSAYASPDGEMSMNANLAIDRAKTGAQAMMSMFKDKKTKVEAGAKEEFYNKVTTAEDWDGFKAAIEASTNKAIVKDRDLILRVLSMYSDVNQREKEIKNISATYAEISQTINPKLRRSVLTVNADEKSRSDEQINKLAGSNPDSLSVEELLYAATLTNDINAKLNIYKQAEKQFPGDWRCANNVGYVYIMQNKPADAQAAFERADKLKPGDPIVMNNLGICARWKGDRKMAMDYYKKAGGAGPEVGYNMGIVSIQNGDYAAAVSSFGAAKSFNSALAKVLSGNAEGALQTIDESAEKDAGLSYYLKAIVGARTNKTDLLINNLKAAIGKDASLKAKAKDDCEFIKFRENADFKGVVN